MHTFSPKELAIKQLPAQSWLDIINPKKKSENF